MFELHVANPDVTGGSIAVSWCLDKETIEVLNKNKIIDPVVVLVVIPDDNNYNRGKESRTVVSLKDLMAYVSFHTVGKNKIYGFIGTMSLKETKDTYLSKFAGRYVYEILNYSGDNYTSFPMFGGGCDSYIKAEPLLVEVPAESFAKEPPKWEKEWVNHFYRFKPLDQCDFRKRRIFAYTVQPLIMLFNILLRLLITIVALLIGTRDFSYKPLLHPLTYDLASAFEILGGGTYFIGTGRNKFLNYARLILAPPFLILVGLLFKFVKIYLFLGVMLGISLFISGTIALVIFYKFFSNIRSNKKIEEDPWYADEKEMKLIICDGSQKPKRVTDLPSNHRTLKLRFHDLKSRVCRPFSI